MKVILVPHAAAPVVSCNVWVGVGSADETPEEAGLAHVHEHMLFKGTARRGVGEIASEVESAGGHINAFTSFDQTCYYVVMSSRYFEKGLDILADAIRNSSFDAEELGRELEVIQEEIKRGEDSPARQAIQRLFELSYAEHPYRLPVIGSRESVASFTRDHVTRFFNKHYVPSNMSLVLVGDFTLEEARGLVDKYFGDFEDRPRDPIVRSEEPAQAGFKAGVYEEGTQESFLRVAFHIPDARHDQIPALDLLSTIMGGGESSPLYQVVQRERELVNSVSSGAYTPRDAGLYILSADYQVGEEGGPASHEEVLTAVMEQALTFRERLCDPAEIERARTQFESQAIYGKQTVEGLATKYGHYQMVTGDPLFEEGYYKRLALVTAEELREVARQTLTLENCSVVVTHPVGGLSVAPDALEHAAREAFAAASAGEVETVVIGGVTPEVRPLPKAEPLTLDVHGFTTIQIPNGPLLVVQEDHAVEIFSLRALMYGGSRFETAENIGSTGLLAEMVMRGTSKRSAVEIAASMESMASGLSGMSGRNTFGFGMTGLTRFLNPCLELFAEVLFEATIPEDEFEREQKLALQELRSRQDNGGAVNADLFMEAFFAGHPYALPMAGTEASLKRLTAQHLREQLVKTRDVRGMALVIAGDVDAGAVAARLTELFAGNPGGQGGPRTIAAPARHTSPILVSNDLDKNQAHITMGFDGPTLESKDRFALEVLHSILSGQGGRLFMELRDKQSLAYSVYASMILGVEASAFTLHIGTSPEKLEQATRGLLGQVRKLHEGGVTADEIDAAKRYLIGNHDIQQQRNSSRAMSVALDHLYGLGYKRVFAYGDHIQAVTADDINAVVKRYLRLEGVVTAITKPANVAVSEGWLIG
jgi:zinc protease